MLASCALTPTGENFLEDEGAVVARCKANVPDAFEVLVSLYERRVYNLAYRMTGSREDAEDILQETFLRVHASMGTFRGDCSLGTWICRIAYNVTIDALRAKACRPKCQDQDEERVQDLRDLNPLPDDEIMRSEFWTVFEAGMNELSPEQRAAVYLRDVRDMTYEDIAAILRCPVGTVKSRLSRARDALRIILRPYLETA